MKSILALLLGVAMGADTDITTSDQAKIKALYDGLLNNAGADTDTFNNWMNNFAKQNFKSCHRNLVDSTGGVWQCTSTKNAPFDLNQFMQQKYFDDNNLIAQDCKITHKWDQHSLDTDCKFTFQNQDGRCTTETSMENIKYDETGAEIMEYFTTTSSIEAGSCGSEKRRLSGNYWTKKPTTRAPEPDDKCYDTGYNNPCTSENIAAGNFYFPSCSGCCNFIQCDESGDAYEQQCGAGTYWDQQLLTCDHNYGQCMDDTCRDPTPQPTPAPVKSSYTKQPSKDNYYGTDDKCYNTHDNNPCTAENRKLGKYHFASCNSCCQFIQCDDFGVAFERPCAPGTYWDDKVGTCNHNNNGQCKDDKCEMTAAPTKVWTTTKAPTKAWTTTTKWETTTKKPTPAPTKWTTKAPTTKAPTKKPTPAPTKWTTKAPTNKPTPKPTNKPTPKPTKWTTKAPTTKAPTKKPTPAPTKWTTKAPTNKPTPTQKPTPKPTKAPTDKPTKAPTNKPTKAPTDKPTKAPTNKPTKTPTTKAPTKKPTAKPTQKPTPAPTKWTTKAPTNKPTPKPTNKPTPKPTKWTTKAPTKGEWPTAKPTPQPTKSQNPWAH